MCIYKYTYVYMYVERERANYIVHIYMWRKIERESEISKIFFPVEPSVYPLPHLPQLTICPRSG